MEKVTIKFEKKTHLYIIIEVDGVVFKEILPMEYRTPYGVVHFINERLPLHICMSVFGDKHYNSLSLFDTTVLWANLTK